MASPVSGREDSGVILFVDDRPDNVAVLFEVLAPLGAPLVAAYSGEEALRCILQHRVAVILLDVRMPGMDGFETASLIKKREKSRRIPIIFLTAVETEPFHILRGYSEGAVDFMVKPFDPWMLRSKVSVFLELDRASALLQRQAEELALSNAELARLAQEAKAASVAKSTFLNMVGHELRTPLSVISGYSALMLEAGFGPVPPGFDKPLRIIGDKVAELASLVEDVIDAAKLDAGMAIPRIIDVELGKIVGDAVRRAQARASLMGGSVAYRPPRRPIVVPADPQHLGRILDNLLNNALTYHRGVPKVSVSVRAGRAPRIVVEDEGEGIPEDVRSEIFDRFVRGHEAGLGPPGTGLGLYISRDLAKRNSADVVLDQSEMGVGSTFSIVFKPEAAEARDGTAPTSPVAAVSRT